MPKRKATSELIRGVDPDDQINEKSSEDEPTNVSLPKRKIFKAVRRLTPTVTSESEENKFNNFGGFDWKSRPESIPETNPTKSTSLLDSFRTEKSPEGSPDVSSSVPGDHMSKIRRLNSDFVESIKLYFSENETSDFRPPLRDYIKYFDQLELQYNVPSYKSNPESTNHVALSNFFQPLTTFPSFVPSIPSFLTNTPTSNPFGLPTVDPSSNPFVNPFLTMPSNSRPFTNPFVLKTTSTTNEAMPSTSVALSPPKPYCFTELPTVDATEDVEDIPEDVVKEDADAANSLFSSRCYLYFFAPTKQEWKKAGVGIVYVQESGGQSHVFLRADASTGLLLMNTMLSTTSMLELRTSKRVCFVSTLEEGVLQTTMLSFSDETDAQAFMEAVQNCFHDE